MIPVFSVLAWWPKDNCKPHLELFITEAGARAYLERAITENYGSHIDADPNYAESLEDAVAADIAATRATTLPIEWNDGGEDYHLTTSKHELKV